MWTNSKKKHTNKVLKNQDKNLMFHFIKCCSELNKQAGLAQYCHSYLQKRHQQFCNVTPESTTTKVWGFFFPPGNQFVLDVSPWLGQKHEKFMGSDFVYVRSGCHWILMILLCFKSPYAVISYDLIDYGNPSIWLKAHLRHIMLVSP